MTASVLIRSCTNLNDALVSVECRQVERRRFVAITNVRTTSGDAGKETLTSNRRHRVRQMILNAPIAGITVVAMIVVTITMIERARIRYFLPTYNNDNLALLIAILSSSIVTRIPRHFVTIATVAVFHVRLDCLATSITKGRSRRRR